MKKVRPMSRSDIRKLTYRLREDLGLRNIPYINVIRLVEIVFPEILKWDDYSFEVGTLEKMQGNHGLTQKHTITIREDVYERTVAGRGRDRFTVMHEVGHLLLHADAPIALARGKVKPYCDPEWQANAFAGEMLVPYHLISGMTVEEIQSVCGVSKSAANYQLGQQKRTYF